MFSDPGSDAIRKIQITSFVISLSLFVSQQTDKAQYFSTIYTVLVGIDYFVREGGGGGEEEVGYGAGAGSIVGIASAILRIRIRNTQNPES